MAGFTAPNAVHPHQGEKCLLLRLQGGRAQPRHVWGRTSREQPASALPDCPARALTCRCGGVTLVMAGFTAQLGYRAKK